MVGAITVWGARSVVLLAVLAFPRAVHGESPEKPERRLTTVPVIAFFPETSLVLGAAVVYTLPGSRGEAGVGRRSTITAVTAVTLKKQFIFEAGPVLYFSGERWRLRGRGMANVFPNRFYPLGPNSPDEPEQHELQEFGTLGAVSRELVAAVRAGVQWDIFYIGVRSAEAGGLLATGRVPGADGGWLVGVGPLLLWDDRDNDIATHTGGRYELSLLVYPEALGTRRGFAVWTADARRFFELPWGHVIGGQLYARMSTGRVPFYRMSTLGGAQQMRGFFEGRFRDRDLLSAQIEYQLPIWWRFRGTLFAGAGDVAANLWDFSFRGVEVAGGGGLRFALNPEDRLFLRFDTAFTGRGDVNFYLSLGEAF